jgi:hypothetical protein
MKHYQLKKSLDPSQQAVLPHVWRPNVMESTMAYSTNKKAYAELVTGFFHKKSSPRSNRIKYCCDTTLGKYLVWICGASRERQSGYSRLIELFMSSISYGALYIGPLFFIKPKSRQLKCALGNILQIFFVIHIYVCMYIYSTCWNTLVFSWRAFLMIFYRPVYWRPPPLLFYCYGPTYVFKAIENGSSWRIRSIQYGAVGSAYIRFIYKVLQCFAPRCSSYRAVR